MSFQTYVVIFRFCDDCIFRVLQLSCNNFYSHSASTCSRYSSSASHDPHKASIQHKQISGETNKRVNQKKFKGGGGGGGAGGEI